MTTSQRSRSRRIRRILWTLGIGSLAFVAIVGLAHTPAGRFMLAFLPGFGGCPAGMDTVMASDERDRLRHAALDPLRGEGPAASRVAFGFELGSSNAADVRAWAWMHAVPCAPGRGGIGLRCTEVPAVATGLPHPVDALVFRFDADDRVVAIDASHRRAAAADAAADTSRRVDALTAAIGPPEAVRGNTDADHLAAGALNQGEVEFRFSDLRARVIATNLGAGRFGVRESWQLL